MNTANTSQNLKTSPVRPKRRAFADRDLCAACGCCVKVCPVSAISIYHGIYAAVDASKCVGCGRCAKECPASIISIIDAD